MTDASKFKGFGKGDILSLSSMMIMEDHDEMSIDLAIKEVREYNEPQGQFNYIAYIAETVEDDPTTYMVLIRIVGDEYDLHLYYLDQEVDISECKEILLTENGEDLTDRFDYQVSDASGDLHDVTMDLQQRYFGVECSSDDDETEDGTRTIGQYFTNDECGDTPYGFIEWTGDDESGWLELWFGSELKEHEINILPVNKEA